MNWISGTDLKDFREDDIVLYIPKYGLWDTSYTFGKLLEYWHTGLVSWDLLTNSNHISWTTKMVRIYWHDL